jgi:hypothetical protein
MSSPNCFLDSFSHYSTNDLWGLGNGTKWDGFGSQSQITTIFISLGTGLFGNSLRISSPGPNNSIYVAKSFTNLATWVMGVRFKTTALPIIGGGYTPFTLLDSGTPQVELAINNLGQIYVSRNGNLVTGGTSTNILVANTWYYIEMMVTISPSISANSWQVNVNGANWINVAAGQSSRNSANSTANQICLGQGPRNLNPSSGGFLVDLCDLYIDGGGSVNGGAFWGDTKIECHWPAAAGTYSAWTPTGALGLGCVNDETPNGDVSYLADNTINDKSTFTFQPLASNPSSIMCVQVVHDSKKADAGIKQIADYCVSSGTTAVGTTVNLANSYRMYTNVLAQDPHTSAAWTASGLNAAEFGVEEIN